MELVAIAEALFLEKGYAETSVDDILSAAGLSKGGFYHYFQSKEEVLMESINHLMDSARNEMEAIVNDPALSAVEKFQQFLEKRKTLVQPKRDLARYLAMLMKSDSALYKYYTSVSQRFLDPLTNIIEQGCEEGAFHVDYPRETADILLRAVTSLPQSPFFQAYLEDETQSARYKAALEALIARTLDVDSQRLSIG